MQFVGQSSKPWLNPLNWNIITNGIRDVYLTEGAPYIERLPCKDDKVSFPKVTLAFRSL